MRTETGTTLPSSPHLADVLSADTERLGIAKKELTAMLEEEELKESILLVFANKQDMKGALNAAQVCKLIFIPALCCSEISSCYVSVGQ